MEHYHLTQMYVMEKENAQIIISVFVQTPMSTQVIHVNFQFVLDLIHQIQMFVMEMVSVNLQVTVHVQPISLVQIVILPHAMVHYQMTQTYAMGEERVQ
jgi:hypothetical protein